MRHALPHHLHSVMITSANPRVLHIRKVSGEVFSIPARLDSVSVYSPYVWDAARIACRSYDTWTEIKYPEFVGDETNELDTTVQH